MPVVCGECGAGKTALLLASAAPFDFGVRVLPVDFIPRGEEPTPFPAEERVDPNKKTFDGRVLRKLKEIVLSLVDMQPLNGFVSAELKRRTLNVIVALDEFGKHPHLIRAFIAIRHYASGLLGSQELAQTGDGITLRLFLAAGGTGTEQQAAQVGSMPSDFEPRFVNPARDDFPERFAAIYIAQNGLTDGAAAGLNADDATRLCRHSTLRTLMMNPRCAIAIIKALARQKQALAVPVVKNHDIVKGPFHAENCMLALTSLNDSNHLVDAVSEHLALAGCHAYKSTNRWRESPTAEVMGALCFVLRLLCRPDECWNFPPDSPDAARVAFLQARGSVVDLARSVSRPDEWRHRVLVTTAKGEFLVIDPPSGREARMPRRYYVSPPQLAMLCRNVGLAGVRHGAECEPEAPDFAFLVLLSYLPVELEHGKSGERPGSNHDAAVHPSLKRPTVGDVLACLLRPVAGYSDIRERLKQAVVADAALDGGDQPSSPASLPCTANITEILDRPVSFTSVRMPAIREEALRKQGPTKRNTAERITDVLCDATLEGAAWVIPSPDDSEFGDIVVAFDGVVVIIAAEAGDDTAARAQLTVTGPAPPEYWRPSTKALSVFRQQLCRAFTGRGAKPPAFFHAIPTHSAELEHRCCLVPVPDVAEHVDATSVAAWNACQGAPAAPICADCVLACGQRTAVPEEHVESHQRETRHWRAFFFRPHSRLQEIRGL